MDHFLWLPLNWGIGWFVLGLVLAAALMFVGRYLGILALSLVLYLGVYWEMWTWVSVVFWIAAILGLVGNALYRARRRGAGLARAGTGIAGFIVLCLLVTSLFGALTGADPEDEIDSLAESFRTQLTTTNNEVKALTGRLDSSVTAQSKVDARQDAAIAKLEARVTKLEGRVDKIENRIERGVTHTASPDDVSVDDAARSIAEGLAPRGLGPDDVTIGTVDWDANPMDTGNRVFGKRAESTQELSSYLKKDTREAKAMRVHIKQALKDALPDEMVESEYKRAMTGKGFVPAQFHVDVCYDGNTYYLNGKAERPDGQTCRQAGDIIWIYVASNGTVIWDASVRADCSNPGLTKPPAPREKSKKSQPPATKPPTKTSTPTPSKTTTPKPTPSKTPTPKPTPSKTPGKNPNDHPCKKGNCPSNTHAPAPAPTGPASPPGGGQPPPTYNPPAPPTAPAPSSSPRPTAKPTVTVDPEPSHTAVPSPTW